MDPFPCYPHPFYNPDIFDILANEPAPENELSNHVPVPSIVLKIVVLDKLIYILYINKSLIFFSKEK
jgi:hypothetical protein